MFDLIMFLVLTSFPCRYTAAFHCCHVVLGSYVARRSAHFCGTSSVGGCNGTETSCARARGNGPCGKVQSIEAMPRGQEAKQRELTDLHFAAWAEQHFAECERPAVTKVGHKRRGAKSELSRRVENCVQV